MAGTRGGAGVRYPRLVPAALTRVRCFVNTTGGLKVKPWASSCETLDALHDLLIARRADEAFWEGLEEMLGRLADDERKRRAAGERAIENESLDPVRRAELMEEIRRALEGRNAGPSGGFGALARSLSVPAAGLLCILGGAMTLGCEGETVLQGDSDTSVDAPVDTAADTTFDIHPDTWTDTPPDSHPDTTPDTPPDTVPDIPVEPVCPHEGMTLTQILEDCIPYPDFRAQIEQCVDGMHSSWRTGLEQYYECQDCWSVEDDAQCLMNSGYPPEFCGISTPYDEEALEEFLDNCAVILYLGVRFE